MSERDPYPSEKQDRFIVRLPDGMRDRIKAAAEANNRSMNAEIVATLEEKYPAPKTAIDIPEISRLLNRIRNAETLDAAKGLAEYFNEQMAAEGHSMRFYAMLDHDSGAIAAYVDIL